MRIVSRLASLILLIFILPFSTAIAAPFSLPTKDDIKDAVRMRVERWSSQKETEKEALKIANTMGTVIEKSRVPGWNAIFADALKSLNQPLLERIASLQAEATSRAGHPMVRPEGRIQKIKTNVIIVDSAQDGITFVERHEANYLNVQIILTTQAIRTLSGSAFAQGDPALIQNAGLQIISAMTRQLAQVANDADPNQIKRGSGEQATLMRANIETIGLLKTVGIAPENLYFALESASNDIDAKLQGEPKSEKALAALTSNRPDANLELSLVRVALTMGRLELGDRVKNYQLSFNPKQLEREFNSFTYPKPKPNGRQQALKDAALSDIKTLDEALSELEAVPTESQALIVEASKFQSANGYDLEQMSEFGQWHHHTLRFNHSYFSLLEFLEKSPHLSAETMARVVAIQKQVVSAAANSHILYPRIKTNFGGWPGQWFAVLHPKALDAFLANQFTENPVYSERLVSELRSSLAPRQLIDQSPLLTMMLEPHAYYDSFHNEILAGLKGATAETWINVMKTLGKNDKLNLQAEFFRSVFPKLNLTEKISILKKSGNVLWEDLDRSLLNDPDQRVVAEAIWQDRGVFALADDWGKDTTFKALDWDAIIQTIGSSPKVAYPQIAESVREFTMTPEYKTVFDPPSVQFPFDMSGRRQPWAEVDLFYYIRGDHNPVLQKSEVQSALKFRSQFEISFLLRNPRVLANLILNQMVNRLDLGVENIEKFDFFDEGRKIMMKINSANKNSYYPFKEPMYQTADEKYLWAWAIKKSRLSRNEQTQLLKAFATDPGWVYGPKAETTLRFLKQQNIVSKSSDLAIGTKTFSSGPVNARIYVGGDLAINRLQDSFVEELKGFSRPTANEHQRAEKFISSLRRIFTNTGGGSDAGARVHEQALATLETFNFSFENRLLLFKRIMTFRGKATLTGDAYFKKYLYSEVQQGVQRDKILPFILLNKYILSNELRASLVSDYLDQLDPASIRSSEQIGEITKTITSILPEPSGSRDDILEKISWQFSINGFQDLRKLDDLKSHQQWRDLTPERMNLASLLSRYVDRFSPLEVSLLINYFAKPERGEMSAALNASFAKVIAQDFTNPSAPLVNEAVRKLEASASQIKGEERLVVFDLLFQVGQKPLRNEVDFQDRILTNFLHLNPTSEQGLWIQSYLSAVPGHERSVTLAYLLARQTESTGTTLSLRDIFEVFQTVGKKAAQGADTWKLVGEEHRAALRDVKDNARALTKFEILQTLMRELPKEQFELIDSIEARLGAASIKTVVRVRLKNGRKIAIAVMNRNALAQVQTNSDFAAKFMSALEKRGLLKTGRIEAELIVRLKAQILDELDMRVEAKKIAQVEKVLSHATEEVMSHSDGWKVNITSLAPEISPTKLVLPIELARGITIDKIQDSGIRQEVGRILVTTYLHAFFENGWFDADRHVGNQLVSVEPQKKEIHLLDFGQAVDFKTTSNPLLADDRTKIADLIREIDQNDVSGIYSAMRRISDGASPTTFQQKTVKEKIAALLHRRDSNPEFMLDLVKTFVDANIIPADRFFTGFFKGFVTLIGEGYVSQADFSQILKKEITDHYRTKPLSTAKIGFSQMLARSSGSSTHGRVRCELLFSDKNSIK